MDSTAQRSADQSDMAEPRSLQVLLATCAHYMPASDLALIRRAFDMAEEAHRGVRRRSGEPFIEHPLAVARILSELAMDAHGIAAALLHDTVEDTAVTLDQVEEQFGPQIATIVDGVTKFDAMDVMEMPDDRAGTDGSSVEALVPPMPAPLPEMKARLKAETVRKLFMAMMRDPRVVLLKLADRLHNMRTLACMPPAKRELIARETLDIYAPLAGRIGLYVFKSELEDLAFSHLQPAEYAQVAQRLHDEETKRKVWAQRLCDRIQRELAARQIAAAVNWRVKHAYRAYVEAQESGMDLALLHDLLAFRVLVTEQDECYRALGIIHHLWHPFGGRIRDYIASPKVNGYQSLHTAIFALDGRLAQIHIRTHDMHRAAQHGVAAYWLERAEAGIQEAPATLPWLQHLPLWISQLANWQRELKLSASDFVETLRGEVFEDQVFVSTPKGDVRELPAGATVLDLAYRNPYGDWRPRHRCAHPHQWPRRRGHRSRRAAQLHAAHGGHRTGDHQFDGAPGGGVAHHRRYPLCARAHCARAAPVAGEACFTRGADRRVGAWLARTAGPSERSARAGGAGALLLSLSRRQDRRPGRAWAHGLRAPFLLPHAAQRAGASAGARRPPSRTRADDVGGDSTGRLSPTPGHLRTGPSRAHV